MSKKIYYSDEPIGAAKVIPDFLTSPKKVALKNKQTEEKTIEICLPVWMIESLDRKARRIGVTRQSLIKIWLAERLERTATDK